MPVELSAGCLQTDAVFVGFAGRIGAGKTTAAHYLRSRYGFQYARYSQTLRAWLGPDATAPHRIQDVGWEIMAGGKQEELNARLIAELSPLRSATIDGLRHPIDHRSLSRAFGPSFRLIFLEARPEIRFDRKRSRFATFADFAAADSQPVEAQIDGLKTLAGGTITNEASLGNLYETLDNWVVARDKENAK